MWRPRVAKQSAVRKVHSLQPLNSETPPQSGLTEDKPAEEKKETKKTKADEDDGCLEELLVLLIPKDIPNHER